jgi:hypothetical protein
MTRAAMMVTMPASSKRLSLLYSPHFQNNFWRTYASVVLSNVYPDVSASAACVRTNSIVHGLAGLSVDGKSQGDDGTVDGSRPLANANRVFYATSVDLAKKEVQNPFDHRHLRPPEGNTWPDIKMIHLPPNRSDLMERYFGIGTNANGKATRRNRAKNSIDLVVFDRFFVEEAHSFRFRHAFPDTALVLDMQDMHSLRWGRQAIAESWDKEARKQAQHSDPLGCLPRVLNYLPNVEDERFLRELASIHRSDLTLVCSPRELHWLNTVYNVPGEKLCLASFFVDENSYENKPLPRSPSDAQPPRFVFCGGFKHAPNADAANLLIEHVWPRLKTELPKSTLHIYGAFCPDHLLAHNRKSSSTGIHVHGYEPDLASIFGRDGGILLAPLRFGAGIKGKIVDAWVFGMPVVTTPIGSEGMTISRNDDVSGGDGGVVFGGSIASTLEVFCQEAVDLARDQGVYRQAQISGFLLRELFSASANWKQVQTRLLDVLDGDTLAHKRKRDPTRAMLWHQSLRSTEYFSRWVEMKETAARETRSTGSLQTTEGDTLS